MLLLLPQLLLLGLRSQFTSLEADKIRLQEEAKSSSSKLEGAIKKAAVARQEVDSLKEELNKLKERLKEEETRAAEKDELLRQSALALLGKGCSDADAFDDIPQTREKTRQLIDFGSTPRRSLRSRAHMYSSEPPKDNFFENIVNPYMSELKMHPKELLLVDGELQIEDVRGPKGEGSLEDRMKKLTRGLHLQEDG
ncbi:hypothetical protein QYE76_023141 [Lolium multiflorum]|uniref:Uncharacterized protein n=1 Tax=Lolium multiflorum TaxID=4521 RepID=A0AAD8RDW8_LOLMU|nr:hypothetical protein QYE76_023141 [Lolium multiflorum]